MRRMSTPEIVLLIAWVDIVGASIFQALTGPVRPLPLGHLAWIVSVAVLVHLWVKRRPDGGSRGMPEVPLI